MSSIVLTQSGPFAGATVPESYLFDIKDYDGNVVLRDGQLVRGVPIAALTPLFLETFPPDEGWGVISEHRAGDFSLPDPYTLSEAGQPVPQPTEWITMKLVDPAGRVVAQATSLAIINGPKAFERGETVARGRLYEALGLPKTTAPIVDEPQRHADRPTQEAAAPERPLLTSVTAMPVITPSAPPAPPAQPAQSTEAPTSVNGRAEELPKRSTIKQIERQAKLQGVVAPEVFASERQALEYLRRLRSGAIH